MRMPTFFVIREFLERHEPRRIVEAGTIEAAVAVVLFLRDPDDPDLLLIKRARHDGDPWSGQIALPGGRRDVGDRSLFATACRETLEETGVRLTRQALVGELDDLHPRTPVLPPIVVRPFVFGLRERPQVQTNPEVTAYMWVSLSSLKGGARISRVAVRGVELDVPSYVVEREIVWGMTERILRPIIELHR